ncbi:MAG: hypothetical protein JOZ57_09990 [Abitibacteriaceae bacterium]|nr:hypothetical protein [Abditibacteriaceae bacterium]
MSDVLEQEAPTVAAPRQARNIQAEEIARDLALMDEIEAFAQSLNLPKRNGADPTPQQIREMAYEDREAALL